MSDLKKNLVHLQRWVQSRVFTVIKFTTEIITVEAPLIFRKSTSNQLSFPYNTCFNHKKLIKKFKCSDRYKFRYIGVTDRTNPY